MILVTGVTGKTGSQLAAALQRAGRAYTGGTRRPFAPSHVRFDWTDRSTWAAALDGVRALYLVKPHDVADPAGTVGALLAAAKGLERVVLLSEMLRETKPEHDPDRAVELVVERSRVPSTILRPSWFMQNFNAAGGYGEPLRERGVIELPSGDGAVSLVDTRDVVDVAVRSLTEPGHAGLAYPLTGPQAVTMSQLAERIGRAVGRPIGHNGASLAEYQQMLRGAGVREGRLRYLMELNTDLAAGRFAMVTDDVRAITGREPRTLDAFVAENVAYWACPPEGR